jgi:hypothetical protein
MAACTWRWRVRGGGVPALCPSLRPGHDETKGLALAGGSLPPLPIPHLSLANTGAPLALEPNA